MLTYRDLCNAFQQLELDHKPAIAHASLSAFGEVQGGAETILGALLRTVDSLIMPTFTYKTMLVPEDGPKDNAIDYGKSHDPNRLAEFFRPDMPADKSMGIIAETLRRHPQAKRSNHPIYSFAGIHADEAIDAQNLHHPFGPIEVLQSQAGWVLLLGVNHTVNTSIHYGEQLVGRRQFIRWALTLKGVVECPRWPGCSGGFQKIAPSLEWSSQKIRINDTLVQAVPLKDLLETVQELIGADPLALLCDREYCQRCSAVRRGLI
jgi:aminoglycoside 3-N-acetyltransferase